MTVVNTLTLRDGGPARNATDLEAALIARAGLDTHMAVIRSGGNRPWLSLSTAAPHDATSVLTRVLRFSRQLRAADILIVHGYYLWWIPLVCWLGRTAGCKIVVVPHGSLSLHHQRFKVAKKTLWNATAGAYVRSVIAAFMVGSEVEGNEIRNQYPSAKTHVTSIGTVIPPKRSLEDGKVNASPAEMQLLSVSRVASKKRIDLMIECVAALRDRGVVARLTVAGDGDAALEEVLREQSRRLGVAHMINFVGLLGREAKTEAYRSADYFLAPSDDENFGISPIEALAHGVPCIASTNVASLQGLPAQAGSLLMGPTGSTLADAILQHESIFKAVAGTAAYEFVAARFSWHTVGERWEDQLRQLVD